MTHQNIRKIWARGITARETGRVVRLHDGIQGLLRSSTINQDGTVTLNLVLGITIPNNEEVGIIE